MSLYSSQILKTIRKFKNLHVSFSSTKNYSNSPISSLDQSRINLNQPTFIHPINIRYNPATLKVEPLKNVSNISIGFPLSRLIVPIGTPGVHERIEIPSLNYVPIMEEPLNKIIEIPNITPEGQVEKHAARLIVIRRRKMNVHKLKKLRRRMKYIWQKTRLRREIIKEKYFLNKQMAQITEAQKFDARVHVANILQKAKAKPLPRFWKREWMPESMIRAKLEEVEKDKTRQYLSVIDRRSISLKDKN